MSISKGVGLESVFSAAPAFNCLAIAVSPPPPTVPIEWLRLVGGVLTILLLVPVVTEFAEMEEEDELVDGEFAVAGSSEECGCKRCVSDGGLGAKALLSCCTVDLILLELAFATEEIRDICTGGLKLPLALLLPLRRPGLERGCDSNIWTWRREAWLG